ncbi:hypothetical protein M413DRAFT_23093 [Hebeloma cylindrosporum]|uniref:Hydrophobin n=1 Tax=Hebeloma cylindrosporum TaxID=76867 RepID=A0A0C3CRN5_HEBCY|nr:hypothetical protein M413DRAFT_23093 [Hebeloma cylindrosporum h7]
MLARIYSLFFLFVALSLVNATAVPRGGGQCNTGPIQCCNQVDTAQNLGLTSALGLLGVVLGPVDALIGVSCSPITPIGASGNSCTAQPVCCTNNNFNGLIAVGCSPVNVNL